MRYLLATILFFASLSVSFAEKRVALIIGNSDYKNTSPLTNPKNDSQDLATKLKTVGFEVIMAQDLDRRGFDEKLALFGRAIQDADAVMFFYAGHGVQYAGQNYLMPVDAKIQDEFSLRFEMTRMDDVMNVISSSRANVKIVILDACRDNPLATQLSRSGTRSTVGKGLAPLEKATGMIVAYATQANSVAQDGVGRNSPFTTAFLHHIDEENLEVGTFFRRVASDVNKATKGAQTPELSVSMLGEFYFKQAETDSQIWATLRQSHNEGDLKAFQARFPKSPFVDAAQSRLQIIAREQRDKAEEIRLKKEAEEKAKLVEAARLQRISSLKAELEHLYKSDSPAQAVAPVQSAELAVAPLVPAKQPETQKPAESPKVLEPIKMQESLKPLETVQTPAKITLTPTVPSPTVVAALPVPVIPPLALPVVEGKVVVGIKTELKRLGCYFGKSDEKWDTPQMKAGLAAFARETKIDPVTLKPQQALLEALKGQTQRICPLTCGNGEVKRGDVCVAKTCPRGQELNDDGDCEKIYVEPAKPIKPKAAEAPKPKAEPAGLSPNELHNKCARMYGSWGAAAFARVDACKRNGGN